LPVGRDRIYGQLPALDERASLAGEILHPSSLTASGVAFPDALAAAADSAGRDGPLLLSAPDGLPDIVAEYIAEIAPTLADAFQLALIYGGEKAVSLPVEADLDAALQP